MPDVVRAAAREGRVVTGPAIVFSIAEEINKLKREPEWASGKRNSVTVVNTPSLGIVLTAIRKGGTVCGHAVEGAVTLQVVSGVIGFGTAGDSKRMSAGTVIALDAGVPHEIQALEDSALLLTIVKEPK